MQMISVSECHNSDTLFFARKPKPDKLYPFSFKFLVGISFVRLVPANKKFNQKQSIRMSEVNIRPLQDRVLVESAAAEEKTAGGIIIPDTAKEKPQRGRIVAIGNGKKDEPLTVKVGDEVLYGKYAGTEISVNGRDYLIMRESDIFAIL
jgi:chaperonin GroES